MADVKTPYMSDVVLRDGSTVRLRAAGPGDEAGLEALFRRLSPESLHFRFFTIPKSTLVEARALAQPGGRDHFVLVGELGGRLSAVASYHRRPRDETRAEVAFAIADELQGRGVGTRMLEALADVARADRIDRFDAFVLSDNDRMMRVFLDSGFEVESRLDAGVFHVELWLAPTPEFELRAAERSEEAATASMRHFFAPAGVAVIGANRQRGKIGAEVLHNITAGGFTGRVAAVHPSATEIDGVPAYPSVAAVPGDVDLAVVCVPAEAVNPVVDECLAKGVKAIV